MLGGTLALLNHSLQLDGRLLRHHLYRLIFVSILYLFVVLAALQSLMVGAPGQWLFSWIAWLNFWFITLAGISFFATSISEEKEEETLGILRMAGISPTALLLGKSTSRLLVAGLLLSLQFPFALLAITLGGVTTDQVVAVFVALLAYTAFVANLALLCSVIARRASGASVMMTILMGLFFFLPPLVLTVTASISGGGRAVQLFDQGAKHLAEMSVFGRLSTIMSTGFDEPAVSLQVKSNLVAGLLLFLLSRIVFDRLTRYHTVRSSGRGILFRPTGTLKSLSPARSWKSALIWKDFHYVAGGKPLMGLKFAGYGLLAAFAVTIAFLEGSANPFPMLFLWITLPVSLMLLIEATLLAARIFRDEVQLNALPTLFLLPMKPSTIAYHKVLGCLMGLLPALIFLGIGLGCGVMAVLFENNSETIFFAVFFGGMGIVTGIAFAIFFVHLVAYLSLVVKWGAIPMSIAIGLVLLVMIGCFMGMIASFAFLGGATALHFMIGSKFRQLGMQ